MIALQAPAQEGGRSKTQTDKAEYKGRSAQQPHIGLTAGVVNSNATDKTMPEYGLDLGFQPVVPFGVGLEASSSQQPSENGIETNRTSVLAKASYNFGGDTPIFRHSYVGVAAGTILRDSGSGFAAGPLVGFDIPLSNRQDSSPLSLGAAAKYLFTDNNEPETLSANGVLKYWF